MDLKQLQELLEKVDKIVWGPAMLVLLMGTGVFLTIRMNFLTWRNLPYALKLVFGKEAQNAGNGGISPFSALMTSLAATIGTGNIVGVATAMVLGGPGAIVWMCLSACFGLSTKFAECMLAVNYRTINEDGEFVGGPMYTMKAWKHKIIGQIMGIGFAVFTVLASFGIGNMTQANSISSALITAFHIPKYIVGIILMFLVFIITIGGISSISKVSKTVVPMMAVFYIVAGIIVIIGNIEKVPEEVTNTPEIAFDDLFDNKVNLQNSTSADFVNKIDRTKDVVYTTYTLNEIFEEKYEIHVNIPFININNEKITNIDKEILAVFYDKVNNIIENSKEENSEKSIYTVSYTAYLNENILSLAIKATLKEGNSAQRLIIKAYTYNISTNEEIKLEEMLKIKGIQAQVAEEKIKNKVQESINYSAGLSSFGYETYKRNIKDDMYKVENSNNYIVGPNNSIYIIYAYGNTNYTSENDIVYIV